MKLLLLCCAYILFSFGTVANAFADDPNHVLTFAADDKSYTAVFRMETGKATINDKEFDYKITFGGGGFSTTLIGDGDYIFQMSTESAEARLLFPAKGGTIKIDGKTYNSAVLKRIYNNTP